MSIFPLNIENKWVYSFYSINQNKPIGDTTNVETTVFGIDTVQSTIVYLVEDAILRDFNKRFYFNKENGFYTSIYSYNPAGPSGPPTLTPEKALAYPTYVGESWNNSTYTIQTKNLNQEIIFSFAKFQCIQYEISISNSIVLEIWASPNIGIVKAIRYEDTIQKIYELKYYNLK